MCSNTTATMETEMKRKLLTQAVCLALAVSCMPAVALAQVAAIAAPQQQQDIGDQDRNDDAKNLDTVVVTGSRVAYPAVIPPPPPESFHSGYVTFNDTVFAVLMISMNGMVGLALTAGGWRHVEQSYNLRGAIAFVQLIAPLSLLLLVMPDYTTTSMKGTLAPAQEAYLGVLCVVVYLLFLWIQTGRHRSYFDHTDASSTAPDQPHEPKPWSWPLLARSVSGLILALLPMVLLSEYLGEAISFGIEELKLPAAFGGLLIASLGLIPEVIGTLRAALDNQVQRSVNICLGSALSTIGLTVPSVLMVAAFLDMDLMLGLSGTNKTLLTASLLVMMLTFVSGGASILQGIVHLMLFLGYIIFIVFP